MHFYDTCQQWFDCLHGKLRDIRRTQWMQEGTSCVCRASVFSLGKLLQKHRGSNKGSRLRVVVGKAKGKL
jgi:hypothetical protein